MSDKPFNVHCETCAMPGLKPAHKAPTPGHTDHCSCSRCFG